MYLRTGYVYKERSTILLIFFFIIFFILIITFWHLQIRKGDYYRNLARNNRIRRVRLSAPRGRIFDRNGIVLVDNRPSYNVMLDPEEARNIDQIFATLSDLLSVEKNEIIANYKSKDRLPYMPALLIKDLTLKDVMLVEEEINDLPGVFLDVEPARNYTYGESAVHILGYVSKINPEELERLKEYGYHYQDYIGKAGIEQQYDYYLRGRAGGMQVQVDHRGRFDRILSKKDPVRGNDLYLTIDSNLQKYIEEIYKDLSGAAVVLNPHSGEVLAMVSKPGYDPNIFVNAFRRKEIRDILRDPRHPLINKAIMAEYAPGSIFKILVAITALQDKIITTKTAYHCSGVFQLGPARFGCWQKYGHNWLTIVDAIRFSCNVFFYNIGLKLNLNHLEKIAQDFGLGHTLGIDLPGEKKGLIPTPEWKKKRWNESWYGGDTVNVSIGQGYVLVTPLQLVSMMATLANGGHLLQPYLLAKVVSPSEDYMIKNQTNELYSLTIDSALLNIVKEGIYKVVNSERGTGKRAALDSIDVSGKTGTIQVKNRDNERTHAWFAGFAPSGDPQIAFVFFIEDAESGGRTAAPLAKLFLMKYFGIEPQVQDDAINTTTTQTL